MGAFRFRNWDRCKQGGQFCLTVQQRGFVILIHDSMLS